MTFIQKIFKFVMKFSYILKDIFQLKIMREELIFENVELILMTNLNIQKSYLMAAA